MCETSCRQLNAKFYCCRQLKSPIGGGAKQERIIGEWGKIDSCSNEGGPYLWMNENVRSNGKARASEVLIDGLSQWPLCLTKK